MPRTVAVAAPDANAVNAALYLFTYFLAVSRTPVWTGIVDNPTDNAVIINNFLIIILLIYMNY